MKQYLELLQKVKEEGVYSQDRTGTGTYSIFGAQMRFDLQEGFPIVTTKRTHFKSIVEELLWFLKGSTNASDLQERGVRIWDEWALKEDEIDVIEMEPFERLEALALKEDIEDRYKKIQEIKAMNLSEGMSVLDGLGIPRTRERVLRKKGDLGPIYGKQWTDWRASDGRRINQIAEAINLIKKDPSSRRIIVNAWNVGDLEYMALPPCHLLFQFYVRDNKLSCQLYQR